jgi:peptide subunit release factor 1 (eRF1)
VDHHYDWSGRSLIMFSATEEGFFQAHPIAVPVRTRARLMEQPYVKPLADLFDAYGDYGVAVVDKQGARLYHFHLGELNEQLSQIGQSIRRTKRGGGSQAPGRRGGTAGQTRYVEELTDRNLKEAAKTSARFFADNRVRRVLIAGTESNAARFTSHLPKQWRSLIVGTFPTETTASHNAILDKAMEIAQRAEKDRETQLVDTMITAAAKGREGVTGLDDTLSAVRAGRLHTLAIREGFRAPGYRCRSCGHMTAHALASCTFCGGAFEPIEDAVEHAVRGVIAAGGEVEVIRGNPKLEAAGNIAGLLRY